MMAFWYLLLAAFLAVVLNLRSRWLRGLGTAVAALGLLMMVSSIILADFNGTFAHRPASHDAIGALTPLILNLQAIVGTAGILFLLWAMWAQFRRRQVASLGLLNSRSAFGLVSRYAHWMVAVLILALIPMGMYMAVLAPDSPDRPVFVAAHQTMGLLVLILVVLRLAWLVRSPAAAFAGDLKPWERSLARAVHVTLYGLILVFPLSGLFMMMALGQPVQFFGETLPALFGASAGLSSALTILHDDVLQILFYAVFLAHLGAVLKHHFVDRRSNDVRRMLR